MTPADFIATLVTNLARIARGRRQPETAAEVMAYLTGDNPHRCGPIMVKERDFARLEAAIEREDAARAARMPDTKAALAQMQDAWTRLKDLGWSEAIYCPKDGTVFEAIEAGSTGVHDCHYDGAWPSGSWWTRDDGDLWPSRPILFRLKDEAPKP